MTAPRLSANHLFCVRGCVRWDALELFRCEKKRNDKVDGGFLKERKKRSCFEATVSRLLQLTLPHD